MFPTRGSLTSVIAIIISLVIICIFDCVFVDGLKLIRRRKIKMENAAALVAPMALDDPRSAAVKIVEGELDKRIMYMDGEYNVLEYIGQHEHDTDISFGWIWLIATALRPFSAAGAYEPAASMSGEAYVQTARGEQRGLCRNEKYPFRSDAARMLKLQDQFPLLSPEDQHEVRHNYLRKFCSLPEASQCIQPAQRA